MCSTDCGCCSSSFWLTWISSFTIEFAVMFSKMSHGVLGVLRTDMALSKVCLMELGHNETVCSDIKMYGDIEVDVQKRVNMFEMYGDIMTQVSTHYIIKKYGSKDFVWFKLSLKSCMSGGTKSKP